MRSGTPRKTIHLRSGLWDQGVSPHFCATRESPPYEENSLWSYPFLLHHRRGFPFPTVLISMDQSPGGPAALRAALGSGAEGGRSSWAALLRARLGRVAESPSGRDTDGARVGQGETERSLGETFGKVGKGAGTFVWLKLGSVFFRTVSGNYPSQQSGCSLGTS